MQVNAPIKKNWSSSITLKILFIGVLILLLFIPIALIDNAIDERLQYRTEAVYEVSRMWGQDQVIIGPVFVVPYKQRYTTEKGKKKFYKKELKMIPEKIQIQSNVKSKILERGIFEVPVYESELIIQGTLKIPDFAKFDIEEELIDWSRFVLGMGISDTRTLRKEISLEIGEEQYSFSPGVLGIENMGEGIHAILGEAQELNTNHKSLSFSIKLHVVGSQTLQFLPLGEQTSVSMNSDWASPSFKGNYLPAERKITESGFEASWDLPRFGRDLPTAWLGNRLTNEFQNRNTFGVHFLLPIDSYKQTIRAVKYAIIFLVLTFSVFFLMEILHGLKIHPVQYLVVGLALCLFYLLLLSLSEHMQFGWSYIVASFSCVAVISLYSFALLKDKARAFMISLLLVLLYSFLYTLLQAEELSLLFGSLGLFIALSGFMYKTRKIDWYNVK